MEIRFFLKSISISNRSSDTFHEEFEEGNPLLKKIPRKV